MGFRFALALALFLAFSTKASAQAIDSETLATVSPTQGSVALSSGFATLAPSTIHIPADAYVCSLSSAADISCALKPGYKAGWSDLTVLAEKDIEQETLVAPDTVTLGPGYRCEFVSDKTICTRKDPTGAASPVRHMDLDSDKAFLTHEADKPWHTPAPVAGYSTEQLPVFHDWGREDVSPHPPTLDVPSSPGQDGHD